jgi:hypothetical protein
MTPARKRRIWEVYDGRCAACRTPVPISGPGVIYDHDIPIWFGRRPDTDDSAGPLCRPCDAIKTPADQTRIAKTKRQQKMATKKPKGSLPPRPFPKGPKRPIPGRGFNTAHRRRMNGSIEKAKP